MWQRGSSPLSFEASWEGRGGAAGAGVAAVGEDGVERVMWFVLERNRTQQQTDRERIRDRTGGQIIGVGFFSHG